MLDEATVEMLKEYFYYREICDDERMDRYFSRTINICRDKYNQLLRIESASWDPLVSNYFERELSLTADGVVNGSANKNSTVTHRFGEVDTTIHEMHVHDNHEDHKDGSSDYHNDDTERVTDDGEMSRNNSGNSGGHSYTNSHNNSTTNTNNHSDTLTESTNSNDTHTEDHKDTDVSTTTKGATKAAPMNASGVGVTGKGKLTGLDFEYASSYTQTDVDTHQSEDDENDVHSEGGGTDHTVTSGNGTTTNNGSGDSTTTHDNSSSSSESGSNYNLRVGTYGTTHHGETGENSSGFNQEDRSGFDTRSKGGANYDIVDGSDTNNTLTKNNELTHERYTGRNGVLPQDALASATNYLMNYSTAFQWLCNKLEPCFIGIF